MYFCLTCLTKYLFIEIKSPMGSFGVAQHPTFALKV